MASPRNRFTLVSGIVVAIVGLLLAAEGAWLTYAGGTPAYLIGGIAYLVVGGLLIARQTIAFWLHLVLFVATLIWAFAETGFNQWTVFTALPRLNVPMLLAMLLALPWAWRGMRAATLPALVPGLASVALLVIGIGVMFSMPWVHHPDGEHVADDGPHVKLPETDVKPGDWPSWGRTKEQSRYSPLDQINTDNVAKLEKVWSYQSGDNNHAYDASPHWGAEATPIKIGDTMYTCTPNAWIIALDPATGKQKWKFKPTDVDSSVTNFVNCRGVAYHEAGDDYTAPDGSQMCKTRIIAPTSGPYIAALDAETGKKCPGFGQTNGMIDLTEDIGPMAAGTLVQTSAPLVMNGRIYTGGNVYDNWYWKEPSGVVRAWDVETGKEVWHWDLGKKNPTAPLAEGDIFTPSTPNVWGRITGDPKNDQIFIGTGNATPDYTNSNRRPFDNEYSGSIVALNAKTGQERWHFQEAHTDTWDFDIPIGPTLVQWPNGHGGHMPALVSTNKQGEIFVLNRKTGEPIKKVVEKKAPSAPKDSSVYKEYKLSKTQPHSVEEPEAMPMDLKATDMWGATPFDQMWCRVRYNQAYYKGPFTPPTQQGSIMYPTFDGVTDWYGASYNPDGGMNIVANYLPFIGTLVPRERAINVMDVARWNGQFPVPPYLGAPFENTLALTPQYGLPYAIDLHPFLSPANIPCNAPPWSTLNQVDLANGKIKWTTPLGNSRHNAPFGLKQFLPLPSSVPELGGSAMTAGGLAFIAGTTDNLLRAYDTKTGKVLWSAELPAGGQANPAIYEANGRQFVVITAGGHQPLGTMRGDYTVAFALPKSGGSDSN